MERGWLGWTAKDMAVERKQEPPEAPHDWEYLYSAPFEVGKGVLPEMKDVWQCRRCRTQWNTEPGEKPVMRASRDDCVNEVVRQVMDA